MRKVETDVVVVGAGFAGLSAAERLADDGFDVLVVEARDRVGGRAHTRRTDAGVALDLGGQWVGPTQDEILALADRLGAPVFPTHNEGSTILDRGRAIQRYEGTIPRISPAVLADVGLAQWRLDRLQRQVPTDEPWATAASTLDTQTAETWIRRMHTATGRGLLRIAVTSLFAAEPSDLSLLHLLFYLRSGGGLDRMLGVADGAQERRFVHGSQDLSERLAARLPDRVLLGAPVRAVEQDADRVVVRGETVEVTARRTIVAIPPALAGRIDYRPALPPARDALTQRMPMGAVIKINVVYDEPFWRADGLNGQATNLSGPVSITFDNSPPDGTPGVLLAFAEGAHAVTLGGLDAGERRDTVLASLSRWFGPRAASPVEYHELDWSTEEWTRGCYGAHLAPGVWTRYGPALRQPVGLIHWAGTETSPIWSGYLDGAVRSGHRAADEVAAELGATSSAASPGRGPGGE